MGPSKPKFFLFKQYGSQRWVLIIKPSEHWFERSSSLPKNQLHPTHHSLLSFTTTHHATIFYLIGSLLDPVKTSSNFNEILTRFGDIFIDLIRSLLHATEYDHFERREHKKYKGLPVSKVCFTVGNKFGFLGFYVVRSGDRLWKIQPFPTYKYLYDLFLVLNIVFFFKKKIVINYLWLKIYSLSIL